MLPDVTAPHDPCSSAARLAPSKERVMGLQLWVECPPNYEYGPADYYLAIINKPNAKISGMEQLESVSSSCDGIDT